MKGGREMLNFCFFFRFGVVKYARMVVGRTCLFRFF